LPTSCSDAASRARFGEPGDAVDVIARPRIAFGERGQEHARRLLARRHTAPVLLGVHALVGEAQRLHRGARLGRQQHGAVGGADHEAVPVLAE
jgi:hypothetical protein